MRRRCVRPLMLRCSRYLKVNLALGGSHAMRRRVNFAIWMCTDITEAFHGVGCISVYFFHVTAAQKKKRFLLHDKSNLA